MSTKNETLQVMQAALYVAGGIIRKVVETSELDESIREALHKVELGEHHYRDVRTMVDFLIGFGDDVRAAERKKLPIVRYLGETLPQE